MSRQGDVLPGLNGRSEQVMVGHGCQLERRGLLLAAGSLVQILQPLHLPRTDGSEERLLLIEIHRKCGEVSPFGRL
jgi:hypothetical protein